MFFRKRVHGVFKEREIGQLPAFCPLDQHNASTSVTTASTSKTAALKMFSHGPPNDRTEPVGFQERGRVAGTQLWHEQGLGVHRARDNAFGWDAESEFQPVENQC